MEAVPGVCFKCKTLEGHIFKAIIEILQNNFKVIYFDVSENGIGVRNIDDNNHVMMDVRMHRDRFVIYQYNKPINIGVHVDHMFKIIKNVKKQDSVFLVVYEDNPGILHIDIERDSVICCNSTLPMQTVQLRNIQLPEVGQYVHSMNVSSKDFFKIVKEISPISDKFEINTTPDQIRIISDNSGMYTKKITIGGSGSKSSTETKDPWAEKDTIKQHYYTQEFAKFAKVSQISSMFKIQTGYEMPIWIQSNAGQLGDLHAYIKNVDMNQIHVYSND